MSYFIRFVGLRRGGNHAIVQWVMAHLQQQGYRCDFFNSANDGLLASLAQALPFDVASGGKDKVAVLTLFEDAKLNSLAPVPSVLSQLYDIKQFLLLRDPFNTQASRIKAGWTQPMSSVGYLEYAYEALGGTNYIWDKTTVLFNKWIADKAYRQPIIESLGLQFTDASFDVQAAPGSAFDPKGALPSTMDLTGRWKTVVGDARYAKLASDQRIMDVSQRLFGFVPDASKAS